jgi:hypothetical protein
MPLFAWAVQADLQRELGRDPMGAGKRQRKTRRSDFPKLRNFLESRYSQGDQATS